MRPPRTPTVGDKDLLEQEPERRLLAETSELRAFFRRRLRNDVDTDDYVQEVFARVIASTGVERISNMRAFLLQTASNLLKDSYRRRATLRRAREDVPIEAAIDLADAWQPSPEMVLAQRDELRVLQEELTLMDPMRRDVLMLARLEGISHAEIAKRLGIDVATVRVHLKRAIAHLVKRRMQT
ncbi:MAG: polymerase subunit sigma-24 [Rhodospirillales bacterium]|jgi:RNA polymerase sigma factor (sigma-70 family)|nr:polymerase subunit sigma-24 [Rhodospirillales bacterium]